MDHRIQSAKPLPGYRIQLTYEGHEPFVLDFTSVVQRGGVFTPMSDPGFFEKVRADLDGRYIEWPGEIDFCADALWLQGHPEETVAAESVE